MNRKDNPCPNQPATGLSRVRDDYKQCPSPWICEKLGCQFLGDGFNAKPLPGQKRRSLKQRVQRINKLLGDLDG